MSEAETSPVGQYHDDRVREKLQRSSYAVSYVCSRLELAVEEIIDARYPKTKKEIFAAIAQIGQETLARMK